jgi:Glycosyl transferases group 1/Glycosyltransferase Family 4
MTSIAIFSTYAPSEGFGGPARTYHQRTVLESAGHDVTHVVVQGQPPTQSSRSCDLVMFVERPFRAPIDHVYNDIDLGVRAAQDRRVMQRISAHLEARQVDLIILEQPFLVQVVAPIAQSSGIPVIYSCQNIEYRLRQELERFQYVPDRPKNRSDQVREIEVAAIELSSRVTAICDTDQAKLREEFGCVSTIVPNGSTIVSERLRPRAAHAGASESAVDFAFAGSSYWPNVEGFVQIATPSLAFLPPTTRIHVAGSISADLLSTPPIARRHSVNASRISLHGFLPMDELMELMGNARSVLVPIFVGEGSNLKSADALGSGAPVIMTRRATHGYEDVLELDSEGVTVVDSAEEFRHAMKATLGQPWPTGRVGERRRDQLSWATRLQPLLGVVDEISESKQSS